MSFRRIAAGLSVATLAAGAFLTAGPAVGARPSAPGASAVDVGSWPTDVDERDALSVDDHVDVAAADRVRPIGENRPGAPGGRTLAGVPPTLDDPGEQRGYPRQTQLRVYPEDPSDRSIKLGLIPYHALAPRLNELQADSDRVSVEVLGESVLGRDVYLVTVTAPETAEETARQHAWREKINADPAAAARDDGLHTDYKAPVWFNANIHGDEWEGTDGSLRVIEHLAYSEDPEVHELLATSRFYFTVSHNPDGRVAGTRQNAAGFDLNRDLVTVANPETEAVRQVAIDTQSLVMLDLHGYVNPTLVSPNTAPHVQNAEYDLYLKHAYPNALGIERALAELGHPETRRADIPIRDREPGEWDDWLPMYAPMYAMLQGTHGHTVEVPLRVNRQDYVQQPAHELRRRSSVNTDVAETAIWGTVDYVAAHRDELVADQIEFFRRANAGEQQRHIPDEFIPGFGEADRYTTEFPRAYVIPAGPAQSSPPAVARLVNLLLANDVEVGVADTPIRLGGRRHPAGSYVVDLHQPKRAIANSILEDGADLSERVPRTYANSALSHGLLWGADVVAVDEEAVPALRQVAEAAPTGGVSAAPGRDLAITLYDGADVRAVNDLLGAGHQLSRLDDGTVVVPAQARPAASAAAREHGVQFVLAPEGVGTPLEHRPVVAAAGGLDEIKALRELGFDVRPVSTERLNAGFDWSRIDVLYVGSGLETAALTGEARADVDAFLAEGGVVARGAAGAALNEAADLLPATTVRGRPDANGIVSVTSGDGVLRDQGRPHSFVYAPQWFTDLGEGVAVEQRYAEAEVLTAGHWIAAADGSGGQSDAAGRPALISGLGERGAPTVLFGTEPLFRDHPKGLYAQVGAAVFWTATG
ncbi:hypothetical protein FHR81_005045 [Actinoalloteichus hoggarensis]|uniref:Zinc carboxypeptidase n=1 Tax=Actinoalloteichus hoggarensis TaxID=1470176 RepID=A0A221WA58_9PSEU|nr:M14 family zinc carboxypeptidase [Actinoalloteichus hoggarensis]ASO22890.1 Zinc carboxypeptidase [Actinoalloteichus hoggarensis]MBB5923968.1 hypothetical protein [Actinoalloteichus hoggarensis]